jgi:hypothetical protein
LGVLAYNDTAVSRAIPGISTRGPAAQVPGRRRRRPRDSAASRSGRKRSDQSPRRASVGSSEVDRAALEGRRGLGMDLVEVSLPDLPYDSQGLGLRDRQTINDAQGPCRSGSPPGDHHARDAAGRNRVRADLDPTSHETGGRIQLQEERRPREGADDGADSVACGLRLADCDFNRAALHPAYPIKRRTSAQRTQASPERRHPEESPALDPLENNIRK